MAFLHKYNTDNIFIRSIIVGLINLLNNKISIEEIISDTEVELNTIPWFFDQSGEEDFMQDYFEQWGDCVHPKLSDGNYDVIPRGIITLGSVGIVSGDLTNKFVRGSYVKEVNGNLESFTAFIRQIPIAMSFEAEIQADTFNQVMKLTESVIEVLYSSKIFRTSYKGFMVPSQVGFPDDYNLEKLTEYTYGDSEPKKLTFPIEIETYLPEINNKSEMHNAKRIYNFADNFDLNQSKNNKEYRGFEQISPISNNQNIIYYDGTTMLIKWRTLGNIRNVTIEFSYNTNPNKWNIIEKSIPNTDFYEWKIKEFNIKRPEVIFLNNDIPYKKAKLLPIIDINRELKNVIILDGGIGYTNKLELEIIEEGATPAKVIPQVYKNSIYKIDNTNIENRGANFTVPETKTINIKISDSYNKENYTIIENIFIS